MDESPNVTYSWSPTTGLSNPNVAQPLANPGTTTTYILTQTIPKTGGGTCSSMDTVVVNKINGPSVANFLGADDTICNYNTKTFNPNTTGLPPGTTYEWSPKSYLDFPMSANAVYNPTIKGQLIQPDPITYTLTASVGGCHFTDNITLSVIYANPSFGGCNLSGEQIITNTNVPDLNETFSWSKLSGAATIIGSTTNSSLLVDVATGASTFQIETTLGSTTCIGTASTPGCGCGVNFSVQCPLVFGDSIRIVATPKVGSVTDYNYTWTPGSGLSNYDSFVTFANDNIDRTYTVNIVSKIDTSFKCSNSIYIDPSSFTLPVIVALDDTVCPGEVINLGETHHAGHTYSWNPSGAVSDYEISNPTHTAVNTIDIIVTKTRTSNLCVGRDTASIVVQDVYANAGEDKVICSSSTLQLGTPALPNCKYSWKPTIAAFQNGTTDSTAQPDVLVAITQTFTLIVTDTITGCNAYDTVTIEVNGIPTLTDYPDTFICYGGNITIGAPAISGVTYSWSPTTGLNNPNIAQPTCSVNSNTAYTLTASFPGGCNAQDNVFVTVHDPSFSLSDISYCPSNGALAIGTAAPTVMTSYNWSPASLLSSSTIRNPSTFNPPPSGNTTFTLQVLDAFGCTADTFLTIIPSLSEPLAGPNKILCKNSSISDSLISVF